MSRQRITVAVFAVVAVVQLAVAASAIVRRELVLRQGEVYRVRTAPVDPVDAFRGRYGALGFPSTTVPLRGAGPVERGQTVWVTLTVDADGFAGLASASVERPVDLPAVRCRVRRSSPGRVDAAVDVALPFSRYYLPEDLAPAAERAYRGLASRAPGSSRAWIDVRVRDGHAVLEELYLDGMPVREFLAAVAPAPP
jgi:uncharacterized membrane-anchored protein